MAHNYILQVTAGTDYDISKHKVVPVNTAAPIRLESDDIIVDLNVRIQSYRGLPRSSPTTSPYFDLPPHSTNKDQYSIAFKFTPKHNISGNDLVFGNDFDHPIRDRLPPGFNTAFKIVKWAVDPGLDGDVYADKPYLYGPAASSVNTLFVGSKDGEKNGGDDFGKGEGEDDEAENCGLVFEEGGDEDGEEVRDDAGVPESEAARKKYFLTEQNRRDWEWEKGRTYGCDFYNPYLDFNDFALRLPGFTMPIMKYWDGQGLRPETKRSHTLRYVLKDRSALTDTTTPGDSKPLFVVLFTLYLKEDVDEHGNVKEGVESGRPIHMMGDEDRKRHEELKEGVHGGDGEKAQIAVEANGDKDVDKKKVEKGLPETSADDVD